VMRATRRRRDAALTYPPTATSAAEAAQLRRGLLGTSVISVNYNNNLKNVLKLLT